MTYGAEFGGRIGDDWRDSEPWWPPVPHPPDGAPNVVLVVLDDVGFAQLGCYGSDIATPVMDGLADNRNPPGQLPYHRAVLAHSSLPPDRAQPPPKRAGTGGRPGHRLPRLLGQSAKRERVPGRDPPGPRLRQLRGGQVAPQPRRRDAHGCPAFHLAVGPGVRSLVRVPRGRDPPVRPCPLPRQPFRSSANLGGGWLSPERGPGRSGHRVRLRPPRRRCRPAVLPLLRHRRLSFAPPCAGPSGSNGTPVPSTRGGTCGASARWPAS